MTRTLCRRSTSYWIPQIFAAGLVALAAACSTAPPSGPDAAVVVCGDHHCEAGETAASCPADCGNTGPTCGDHVCEQGEATSCPGDCAACGNHVCEANEAQTCPQDCATCGDGVCAAGEDTSCPQDCTATLTVNNTSSYTIYNLYVWACGNTSMGPDQLGTNIINAGNTYNLHNIPPGCYNIRANGPSPTYWQTTNVTFAAAHTYTWTLTN